MSDYSDELLFVISAKQEMSWSAFKQVFDYLYTLHCTANQLEKSDLKRQRMATIRTLNALAHCEFDFTENYSKVYVAPPVLVRLPAIGFPQAILTGGRSPTTILELSDACQSVGDCINLEVIELESDLMLIPKRVVVQAEEVGELNAIANYIKIPFRETPSAWSILHFAASIDDYLATLQWSNDTELNWQRQTFDPISLQFRSLPETDTNIRISQYTHPSRNTNIYYLWQDEKCTQVDPDWGRYIVLKTLRMNVIIYDRRRFIMAVPARAKLPRLLERSLTLCSGYVSRYIEKLPFTQLEIYGFNLFRAIPPQIAEMTAFKLGQTLTLKSLDITL